MKRSIRFLLQTMALLVLLIVAAVVSASAADESGKWITAWGTGSTNISLNGYENITAYIGNITARTVITPTASGNQVRVRLSNHFGTDDLKIETCTVAKSVTGSRIDESTLRFITFNGYPSVSIPAGAEVLSDPVEFNVVAQENIALSVFLKDFSDVKTMGLSGGETYIKLGEADNTRTESFGLLEGLMDEEYIRIFEEVGFGLDPSLSYSIIHVVPIFSSVDVYSSNPDAYSVVVVGDSTVSNNFPQYLSEIITNNNITDVGVVGKGIIGNQLGRDGLGFGSFLFGESMLNRFQRDVLSQSGVKYVIVKIGTNDIVHPVCKDVQEQYPGIKQPTAEEIIENFRTVFRLCHDNNIRVVAVGITQWKGYTRNFLNTGKRYDRTEEERHADWEIALKVNDWLATTTEHDGYVDYYEVTKNPEDPEAMRPEYTLDGAHPTDLMLKVWAQEFPLSLIGIGSNVGFVRLNKAEMSMKQGQTAALSATIYPTTAANKAVTWTSSNATVASVDENGVVHALGPGSCVVTCTTDDGKKTASCRITVTIPVGGVMIDEKELRLYATKKGTLTATVLPENASDKSVRWSSANSKVAVVDEKTGVVTAVGSGSTKVTCTTVDGGYKASCAVTVYKKVEVSELTLNVTSKSIYVDKSFRLSCTIVPTTATFKEVTWKTDNAKVAKVDNNGLVTGVGVGTAYITCTSVDNPFAAQRCKVNVSIAVGGVSLDQNELSLYETATALLTPTVLPKNATNKKVIWSSSDTSVATVNSKGLVKAVKAGSCVITCTTKNRNKTATCKVTVLKTILSKSVRLEQKSLTLKDGKSATLVASIQPSNASINTVTWSTDNKKVATVNSAGKVTAMSPGTCTITCTTKDTGKTASCKVTVKASRVQSVALNKKIVTITAGDVVKLKATITPSYATNKKVTWASSNPKIVKVSQKGNIKGLKAGKATVTCTTADGKKVAACAVTVKASKIRSITVPDYEITIGLNAKYKLKPTVQPATARSSKLKYSSSDSRVAKVNSKGVITGVSEGSCIITIAPTDGGGGKPALIVVKVENIRVTGIKLSANVAMLLNTVTVTNGTKFKLTATVLPSNATNKKVTWKSSDTNVAKVDSKGNVTTVGTGTCHITCVSTEQNNPATATCRVFVR